MDIFHYSKMILIKISLPILCMDLYTFLARLMTTRNEYSIFILEIANITQFFFIKLVIFIIWILIITLTLLTFDTMLPDFICLTKHFNFI